MMASQDSILALALLKTNWELRRKSYIDNFNLLTAECLRRSPYDVASASQVQADLYAVFGLQLPINTVATLLKRAAKQGLMSREHGVYKVNRDALKDLKFEPLQQSALQAQEALFQDLALFAKSRFNLQWTSADAERAIHDYLAEEAVTVLRATTRHSYVPLPRRPSKSDKFVLASYVNSLVDSGSAHFDHLRVLAEGNMLVRGIFLPEGAGEKGRKYSHTKLFFDTKFLLSALGHAGESLKAPNAELLQLLRKAGATLCCFVHTLDEVRSVLVGCARNLRAGTAFVGYGPVYDHFLGKGASESDVLVLANRVDQDLGDLGILLCPTPAFTGNPVDEKKLEDSIGKRITYVNRNALVRDISSVAAVIRLRGDSKPRYVESCGALFVTTNRPLIDAVLEFTKAELPEEQVAVAVLDSDLTNLVWLKQPSIAPELPRHRLIATCYAALQPTDDFRRRYLDEVERLQPTAKYTDRDVILLRHSLEARRIAMDMTVGDEEAFTTGTVPEVLEVLHLQIQGDARAQLELERSRTSEAAARAEVLKAVVAGQSSLAVERVSRRESRTQKIAGILAWAVTALTTVMLAGAMYLTLPWVTTQNVPRWVRPAATVVVAALNIATWVTSKFTAASFKDRLQQTIARPLMRLFAWLSGD